MNSPLIERDRVKALEDFANASPRENGDMVPSGVFAAPAERVFGAQPVAVKRDDSEILRKLKVMAAAAGEDWFYRFPVRKKVENPQTGKEEWATDYIEGPSIKCANNVSRLYGNCDIDVRVFDVGDSYMFYARFMDLETGYSLVRPFRQRKGQKVMKTDAGRAEDIVFQIGASKAIRNVINNALEFFTNFAADEAKNSIIEKVGRKLPFYREKVAARLADLKIDVKRVEVVRGRMLADWLAADVARTIAELQAIGDGMATIDETYPAPDQEIASGSETTAAATGPSEGDKPASLDQFAGATQQAKPSETVSASQEQAEAAGDAAGRQPAAETVSTKAAAAGVDPKTEADYIAHANAWRDALTNADAGLAQWGREKAMRNKANVAGLVRDDLKTKLDAKVAQLREGKA